MLYFISKLILPLMYTLKMNMKLILVIGAGSFIGGVSRYLLSLLIQAKTTSPFPLHTFTVNIIGCFFIGIVFGIFDKGQISPEWKSFLATGVLGGFTTFSAFSIETFTLFREGYAGYAMLYIVASVFLGLLASYIAYLLIK
jgi:CrcB protein